MGRKYMKRSDEEWYALLQDCMSSGMTIKAWCQQHGITCKAFYYHRRVLCQMGYDIPQRSLSSRVQEQREAVCIDLSDGQSFYGNAPEGMPSIPGSGVAVRIDFRGMSIEVSNHAAHDTITDTFSALRMLC